MNYCGIYSQPTVTQTEAASPRIGRGAGSSSLEKLTVAQPLKI